LFLLLLSLSLSLWTGDSNQEMTPTKYASRLNYLAIASSAFTVAQHSVFIFGRRGRVGGGSGGVDEGEEGLRG